MSDHRDAGGVRILIVPEDGRDSRSFRLGRLGLRAAVAGALLAVVLFVAMAGSWWYLAARAARAHELQARVALLEGQQGRIEALASELRSVEERYDRIRDLFGSDTTRVSTDLWLPPVGGAPGSGPGPADGTSRLPTSWPLTERGFITQPLLEGGPGTHRGLDIAVPADSYIRAAGGGTVEEVGEDPVYGRFLTVEHDDGYRSLYAHASLVLAGEGRAVRTNEVIGLTGSTGRSTAPHLHFEVTRDGEPVDPLSLVNQP